MTKKIVKKTENYGNENLLIINDSEPSRQPRFKFCTQTKPTLFTDSFISGNFSKCEMTK